MNGEPIHETRVKTLALTFGTLLSSQGADAHRLDSSEAFWGNLRNTTSWFRTVKHDLHHPDSHLVGAQMRSCLVLGGLAARLHLAVSPCREQGEH